MRFCCFVVSLFLLSGRCFAEVKSPQSDAISEKASLIERRLSDGEPCSIEIQAASPLSIVLHIGGRGIRIPEEFLVDLSDCHLPDGAQVADFAGDIFLLLAGGSNDGAWQAKITLRDGRVVERELKRGEGAPAILVAASPLDVHDGKIPPEEVRRIQDEFRTRENAAGRNNP